MIGRILQRRIAPTFLIIGAQKAGTTALFHYLSSHPQIAAARQKEIDYFWLDGLYGRGEDWYLQHFPRQSWRRKLSFEACPHYLFSPLAAQRIHDFNPQMKIIVLLRNPIDRAFSQFQMYQRRRGDTLKNQQSAKKYGGALSDFFNSLNNLDYFIKFYNEIHQEWAAIQAGGTRAPFLITQGFYVEQIRCYLQFFPKGQMLFIPHESLKSDTRSALRRITNFLGIRDGNWAEADLKEYHVGNYNENMRPDTRLLLQRIFKEPNERLFEIIGQRLNW